MVERAWGSPKGQSYASVASSRPKLVAKRMSWDPSKRKEEQYWACRKAVRLRPVPEGNDREALEEYLTGKLKISRSSLGTLGLDRSKMERVPYGPKSKFKNEMVVWFPTVEARDVVKGAARNLAVFDQDHGVRLELPNHLKSGMQALQAVSYQIKKKNPAAKRNVLFDDSVMDLALDFTTGEGNPWRRISAKQARQAKRKLAGNDHREVKDSELEELMGTDAEDEELCA